MPRHGDRRRRLHRGGLQPALLRHPPSDRDETHPFLEAFGAAAQPSFSAAEGLAVKQSSGDLYVIDQGAVTVSRFHADGTPDDFSALGTNVIDGQGSGDGGAGGLSFASPGEVQVAVDDSGTATDGDIYVTQIGKHLIDVFSSTGAYLGQLTASSEGNFGEPCGVAVDSAGAVYVGDYSGKIHKFVPAANPPVTADNTANFSYPSACTLAAGAGPTAGFIFADTYGGELAKLDSSTGEVKYTVASGVKTVSVDPASGHVYALKGSELEELDASGAGSASTVSSTPVNGRGVAIRGSNAHVFISKVGSANVSVYGPAEPAFIEPPEQGTPGGVSGSPQVGNNLFCEAGSWSGEPSFTYQWLRNGSVIAGAGESSYALTAEDLEKVIQCRVTATNAVGATVAVNAAGTGARYVQPIVALIKPRAPCFKNLPLRAFSVSTVLYRRTGIPALESRNLYSYDIATQKNDDLSVQTPRTPSSRISPMMAPTSTSSRKRKSAAKGKPASPTSTCGSSRTRARSWLRRSGRKTPLPANTWTGRKLWRDLSPVYQLALVTISPLRATGPLHRFAQSHTESSADGSVLLFTSRSQLTSFRQHRGDGRRLPGPDDEGERASRSTAMTRTARAHLRLLPSGPGPATRRRAHAIMAICGRSFRRINFAQDLPA